MRNTTSRVILGVVMAAVVAGVVGFVISRGGGEEEGALTSPAPTQAPETEPTAEPEPGRLTPPPGATFFAAIHSIKLVGETYEVEWETFGYEPKIDPVSKHLHFFWNTVPPSQAGLPGSGPWQIYPTRPEEEAEKPFRLFGVGNRPQGATQICVLVANADHSVIQGSGNCLAIP